MREIKYRAYLKEEKEYPIVDGIGLQIHGKSMLKVTQIDWFNRRIRCEGTPSYMPFEDIELMQYTGLTDKNGVEIYEGDVLCEEGSIDSYFFIKVIFKHGCFGYICSAKHFVELGRNQHYFDLVNGCEQSHRLEVIGNIYEKQELIE